VREVVELADARIDRLYYLPVTSRLRRVVADRIPTQPNERVFVSLGGDDDLDLVARTVAAAPHLHFCVPTVSWEKPGSEKRFVDVRISAPNVTAVDCADVHRTRQMTFTPAYRGALDSCDTVLIATRAEKMFQMRGGVRIADALFARKHIVMAENAPAQLLMAQHQRTCLVAEHAAQSIADQLQRVVGGSFSPDISLYENDPRPDRRVGKAGVDCRRRSRPRRRAALAARATRGSGRACSQEPLPARTRASRAGSRRDRRPPTASRRCRARLTLVVATAAAP
jgi:hypothetical protein